MYYINAQRQTETRELLEDAILLYKIPASAARNDAVEKIWDAWERLKTFYITLDKKKFRKAVITIE